jgi:uncharacterized YigZ family protein
MLFDDTYRTIATLSKGIYKEKSSKFIALAIPVLSEAEVMEHLKAIKKEFYNANHHCYAYSLGFDKQQYRYSDDREPSGTAGKTIYGQILSHNLTNILVVVVRYFGGTKLGVAGLINAYKSAAKEALNESTFVTKSVNEIYTIEFEYEMMNDVMKILKEYGVQQLDSNFDKLCRIKVSLRKSNAIRFVENIKKIRSLTYNYIKTV